MDGVALAWDQSETIMGLQRYVIGYLRWVDVFMHIIALHQLCTVIMVYRQQCAYLDLVITVGVLHLFHNDSGYSLHEFIAETMYNLLNTQLLLLVILMLQLTSY